MIYLESANAVILDLLKNSITGSYVNDATVSGVLKNSDGDTLGTITFTHVSGNTTGKYYGVITNSMISSVSDCDELTLTVTGTSGSYPIVIKQTHTAGYGSGI